MRALLLTLALLLLPLAAGTTHPVEGERYVPEIAWRDPQDAGRNERRIGRILRAMGEPALSTTDGPGPWQRRFRLLVLPDLPGHYWAVRIDERPSGDARIRVVVLGRGGKGRSPGPILHKAVFAIDGDEMRPLRRGIGMSGLIDLHPEGEPLPKPVNVSEDETLITVCVHPTTYIFEIVEPGISRFVMRDGCNIEEGLQRFLARIEPFRSRLR